MDRITTSQIENLERLKVVRYMPSNRTLEDHQYNPDLGLMIHSDATKLIQIWKRMPLLPTPIRVFRTYNLQPAGDLQPAR